MINLVGWHTASIYDNRIVESLALGNLLLILEALVIRFRLDLVVYFAFLNFHAASHFRYLVANHF